MKPKVHCYCDRGQFSFKLVNNKGWWSRQIRKKELEESLESQDNLLEDEWKITLNGSSIVKHWVDNTE